MSWLRSSAGHSASRERDQDPEKGNAPEGALHSLGDETPASHSALGWSIPQKKRDFAFTASRAFNWFLSHFAPPNAPSTIDKASRASSIEDVAPGVDLQAPREVNIAGAQRSGRVEILVVDRVPPRSSSSSDTSSLRNHEKYSYAPTNLDSSASYSQVPLTLSSFLPRLRNTAQGLAKSAVSFFYMKEDSESLEHHFREELWWQRKRMSLIVSFWMVLNWALTLLFLHLNEVAFSVLDSAFFYGIAPALTIPIPMLVAFDLPRNRRTFYEIWLFFAVYSWSFYLSISMYICGFFNPHKPFVVDCPERDFLGFFYQALSLPVLGTFCMRQSRFSVLVGTLATFALSTGLLAPEKDTWIRHMINYLVFKFLLIWVHYEWELSDRTLHRIRETLKHQFKASNRIQRQEQRTWQAKEKFTSYVFHEVRVPLNSAILAAQNIEAAELDLHEVEDDFRTLQAVLRTMENVLNDMLDFNRMEAGRVSPVSLPFKFHQVIKDMASQLKLSAKDRGLELRTELDPAIDKVARLAAYRTLGVNQELVEAHIATNPQVEGSVSGDETRLRQIIGNLVSNACKFTPPGGQVAIRTKLVVFPDKKLERSESNGSLQQIQDGGQNQDPSLSWKSPEPQAVASLEEDDIVHKDEVFVRVEVSDTGCGIKRTDLRRGLFSEFNQTEVGRTQGGKGTGLGLALVKNIVAMCGGRLGASSKWGEGSLFWFELPLKVGAAALNLPQIGTGKELPLQEAVHQVFTVAGTQAQEPLSLPEAIDVHASLVVQSVVPTLEDRQTAALRALIEPTKPHSHHEPMGTPNSSTTHFFLNSSNSTPSPSAEKTRRPTYVPLPKNPLEEFSESGITTLAQLDSFIAKHDATPTTPPIETGLPVLIVEDDPSNRTLLTRMLTKQFGCVVTTAENGLKGLEVLATGHATPASFRVGEESSSDLMLRGSSDVSRKSQAEDFAVIFLDNQMPFKSGLDVVRELRNVHQRHNDFVVGVTGNATIEDQKEFKAAGANLVLTKPIKREVIQTILSQAAERWRTREDRQNIVPPV